MKIRHIDDVKPYEAVIVKGMNHNMPRYSVTVKKSDEKELSTIMLQYLTDNGMSSTEITDFVKGHPDSLCGAILEIYLTRVEGISVEDWMKKELDMGEPVSEPVFAEGPITGEHIDSNQDNKVLPYIDTMVELLRQSWSEMITAALAQVAATIKAEVKFSEDTLRLADNVLSESNLHDEGLILKKWLEAFLIEAKSGEVSLQFLTYFPLESVCKIISDMSWRVSAELKEYASADKGISADSVKEWLLKGSVTGNSNVREIVEALLLGEKEPEKEPFDLSDSESETIMKWASKISGNEFRRLFVKTLTSDDGSFDRYEIGTMLKVLKSMYDCEAEK
jgi:hypothetical protein